MNTIKQKNAICTYARVSNFKENHSEKECKEYGVMAMKLPFLVQKAGLAQALAFVDMKAKGDDTKPVYILLKDLAEVVLMDLEDIEDVEDKRGIYLEKSRLDVLPDYILLTRKTMAALDWFRRYAQSILKVSSTTTEDDE